MQRNETFAIANPQIEIDNSSGRVDFVTHDDDTVVVTVESMTASAEEIVEATKIVAHGSLVKVSVPNRPGFRKREILVRIEMPASATVKVSTVSADVECRGAVDQAIVKTISGDIRFETVVSSAEVKSISGDIEMVHSPTDISVSSTSGDIRLDHFSGQCIVKSVSGDCLLHATGAGEINVKTVSGDVSVLLEPDINIDVALQSVSGRLSSEIDLEGQGPLVSGPALTIRSKTVSGDVRIRRASLVG